MYDISIFVILFGTIVCTRNVGLNKLQPLPLERKLNVVQTTEQNLLDHAGMWDSWIHRMIEALSNLGAYDELYRMILEAGFPKRLGYRVCRVAPKTYPQFWVVCNRDDIPVYLLNWEHPGGTRRVPHDYSMPSFPRRIGRLYAFGTDVACCTAEDLHPVEGKTWYTPIGLPRDDPYSAWDHDLLEKRTFRYLKDHFDAAMNQTQSFQPRDIEAPTFRNKWDRILIKLTSRYQPRRGPRSSAQKPLRTQANPHSIRPFPLPFPNEITASIIDFLSDESLRNFALSNSTCNWLCSRRLWTKFAIKPVAGETAFWDVQDRVDALLRIPQRTLKVRQLVIHPCVWPWTYQLLCKFEKLWPLLRYLKDLRLLSTSLKLAEREASGDFTPLIRTLRSHGDCLDLKTFRCETWLRPQSDLLDFLKTQTSITELAGVDILSCLTPHLGPSFLPSLRTLGCRLYHTAISLIPSRSLSTLKILMLMNASKIEILGASAFKEHSNITELHIGFVVARSDMPSQLRQLAHFFPNLRLLSTWPLYIDKDGARGLAGFDCLEEVCCMHDCDDAEEASLWASSAPSLKRLTFKSPHNEPVVWVKKTGSESDLGNWTLSSEASLGEHFRDY